MGATTCGFCGQELAPRLGGRGRPKLFCTDQCRRDAYRLRKLSGKPHQPRRGFYGDLWFQESDTLIDDHDRLVALLAALATRHRLGALNRRAASIVRDFATQVLAQDPAQQTDVDPAAPSDSDALGPAAEDADGFTYPHTIAAPAPNPNRSKTKSARKARRKNRR